MRKILLLLALISIIYCQTVYLEKGYPGNTVDTEIINPAFDHQRDKAIYGWIKVNPKLYRGGWSTLFHFTSNPKNVFVDGHVLGDRSLSFFMINNIIVTPTYSIQPANANIYTVFNFVNEDLDKWAFFYVGHSSDYSEQYTYIGFEKSLIKHTAPGIIHKTSTYYRMMIGQSKSYLYFQGAMFRITLHIGEGSYRKANFESLQQATNPVAPTAPAVKPSCVTFYSQCYFQGVVTQACGSVSLDVNNIKSVYIPDKFSYTIKGGGIYAGKSVTFTSTVNCMDKLNWV